MKANIEKQLVHETALTTEIHEGSQFAFEILQKSSSDCSCGAAVPICFVTVSSSSSLDSVFDEVAFDDETIYHRLVQRELK